MNTFQLINASETRELLAQGNVTLVDIRDASSYNSGHIDGAVLLNNDSVEQFLENTDKAQPVVVYCYHGISSQNAAGFLVQQGFSNVFSLEGGYEGWKNATR